MSGKSWPLVVRFEATEDDRRAVAAWYGGTGMATLPLMRRFLTDHGYEGVNEAVRALDAQEAPQ